MPLPATEVLPERWTLPEVSEMTGRSLRELEDAAREGQLTHYHIGRSRTMSREHIDAMVASFLVEKDTAPRPKRNALTKARGRVLAQRARSAQKAA